MPAGVTVIDGYFVFPIGDGRCFASELNATSVSALSFGKAEYKPDGLVRAVAWAGRLYLFGTETTEVWQTRRRPVPVRAHRDLSQGARHRDRGDRLRERL